MEFHSDEINVSKQKQLAWNQRTVDVMKWPDECSVQARHQQLGCLCHCCYLASALPSQSHLMFSKLNPIQYDFEYTLFLKEFYLSSRYSYLL